MLLTAPGVPEHDGAVVLAGRQQRPVRAEGGAPRELREARIVHGRETQPLAGEAPELDAVFADRRHITATRVDGDLRDRASVARDRRTELSAGLDVPDRE